MGALSLQDLPRHRLTWGQRKDLKRGLSMVFARDEANRKRLQELAASPEGIEAAVEEYGAILATGATKLEAVHEAVILAAGVSSADLDAFDGKPSELLGWVAEFLAANADPGEAEAAKKVDALLAPIVQ
jgi:hypothetical protein